MSSDVAQFKEKVLEEVSRFPEDKLPELYDLIHHLRLGMEVAVAKDAMAPSRDTKPASSMSRGSHYLLSIAGLGASEEYDLSERDEEVLAQEIDPERGWGLKRR